MEEGQKATIINAVKTAGKLLLELEKEKSENLSKINNFDYGIPADKKSEDVILKAIKASGLNCQVISEEVGLIDNEQYDYKVYIDPLDGSVNFSRGIPCFCVGVAIYSKVDEPLLGIIYDPNADELFIAEKGRGIELNGQKITPRIFEENALINLEWFGAEGYEDIVKRLRVANLRARTVGSGVLALCYGCIGRGDGAILLQNRPWDVAPGLVFAQEAQLIVKTLEDKDADLSQEKISIITAPRDIFNKIIQALKDQDYCSPQRHCEVRANKNSRAKKLFR